MNGEELIEFDRATVTAFRDKRDSDLVSRFFSESIGITNDGIKTAEGEVHGMRALELDSIHPEDVAAAATGRQPRTFRNALRRSHRVVHAGPQSFRKLGLLASSGISAAEESTC